MALFIMLMICMILMMLLCLILTFTHVVVVTGCYWHSRSGLRWTLLPIVEWLRLDALIAHTPAVLYVAVVVGRFIALLLICTIVCWYARFITVAYFIGDFTRLLRCQLVLIVVVTRLRCCCCYVCCFVGLQLWRFAHLLFALIWLTVGWRLFYCCYGIIVHLRCLWLLLIIVSIDIVVIISNYALCG